jgi:hypothetical protein
MIFAVSFEIIIQRAVGNESCYPMKIIILIQFKLIPFNQRIVIKK